RGRGEDARRLPAAPDAAQRARRAPLGRVRVLARPRLRRGRLAVPGGAALSGDALARPPRADGRGGGLRLARIRTKGHVSGFASVIARSPAARLAARAEDAAISRPDLVFVAPGVALGVGFAARRQTAAWRGHAVVVVPQFVNEHV